MSKLSIVVPVYNEAKSLAELHSRLVSVLQKLNKEYEIIFVDDGSQDDSFQTMQKLAPLKAVRLKRNYGESTALGVGFSLSSGDIIITVESDLEISPEDIPLILNKLDEGFDMSIGWRQKRWGGNFFSRYLPSFFANNLISWVSGIKLHDNGCMLRAYRREILNWAHMTGERHRMFAVFVALEGGKIGEVPISFSKRKHGKSAYGISRSFKVVLDLLVFYFFRRYALRPIHFFGGAGFTSLFFGFLSFLWATYLKFFDGVNYNRSPLMSLVAIFIVVGFQFILMGLLAEFFVERVKEKKEEKDLFIKQITDKTQL
jgi:glycosyltransferase involved in cell wall biosynthesis